MNRIVRWVVPGLAGLLVFGAVALPYLGGFPLAYVMIGLSILLALWLIPARVVPKFDRASLFFIVAWVLILIAFVASRREPGDVAYASNFAMFLLYAPLSTALAIFASEDNARRVAGLALAGSVVAFSVAFYQSWELLMPRATGFGSDPIWAAQAAIVLGFLALIGIEQNRTSHWRHLYWIGPLLGTLTAFLGQSRGPLLAMPVLVVIGIVFAFRRWWLALPVAIATTAVAIAGLSILSPSSLVRLETMRTLVTEVLAGETIGEVSTSQRLAFYESSVAAFLDAPLFGHGWAYKLEAIIPHLADRGAMLAEGHHHLHADIADFGVSAGILGLIAYFLVIAAPIAGALASPRDSMFRTRLLGTILLSAAYFSCGLTYLMFGYEFHTTLYVVLSAILLGYCRDSTTSLDPAFHPPLRYRWPSARRQ